MTGAKKLSMLAIHAHIFFSQSVRKRKAQVTVITGGLSCKALVQ